MSFKKYRDLILGVAALAFSGFYLYNATQIKTRPKLTPSYASAQIVPRASKGSEARMQKLSRKRGKTM